MCAACPEVERRNADKAVHARFPFQIAVGVFARNEEADARCRLRRPADSRAA